MVRQWSPPYNRSQSLPALKRYGQRGGGLIMLRRKRRRTGGTIFGKGESYPLMPDWYIRRLAARRRRYKRR